MKTSLPIPDPCPRNQHWRVFNDLPEVSHLLRALVVLVAIAPPSNLFTVYSYCLQLLFTVLITLRLPDSTDQDHRQLAIYITFLSLQIARIQATVQLQ